MPQVFLAESVVLMFLDSRQEKQTKSEGEELLSLSCPLKLSLSLYRASDAVTTASFNSTVFQNTETVSQKGESHHCPTNPVSL